MGPDTHQVWDLLRTLLGCAPSDRDTGASTVFRICSQVFQDDVHVPNITHGIFPLTLANSGDFTLSGQTVKIKPCTGFSIISN